MRRRQFLAAMGAVAATQRRFNLEGDGPVVATRFPYVQNVREDRATIMWATISPGQGYVEYSSDGLTYKRQVALNRDFTADETKLPAPFTQYTATLTGLSPNVRYSYYPVVDGETVGSGGAFLTASSSTSFKFLVVGDTGWGSPEQGRVAQRLNADSTPGNSSFLIHVGDIAYGPRPYLDLGGNYPEYDGRYFEYYRSSMSRIPFYPVLGNHDYGTKSGAPFCEIHSVPAETVPSGDRGRYYSFDWGNAHLIALDSNAKQEQPFDRSSAPDPTKWLNLRKQSMNPMLEWLERDLKNTRKFWRIAFFHHPVFAAGPNLGAEERFFVLNTIGPILEAYGVQLVLTGHEHSYQRSYQLRNTGEISGGLLVYRQVSNNAGTYYMTTGGGGADLYFTRPMAEVAVQSSTNHHLRVAVEGTRMTVVAVTDLGSTLDSFTIAPSPALNDSGGLVFDRAQGIIRFRGRNLATGEDFKEVPTLSGTTVTVSGRPITLLYASPSQVNGLISFPVTGRVPVSLTTANGRIDTFISA